MRDSESLPLSDQSTDEEHGFSFYSTITLLGERERVTFGAVA